MAESKSAATDFFNPYFTQKERLAMLDARAERMERASRLAVDKSRDLLERTADFRKAHQSPRPRRR